MTNDEQELIAARRRLDDAGLALNHFAMTNSPITAEQREAASVTRALADLEYERAKAAYQTLLIRLAQSALAATPVAGVAVDPQSPDGYNIDVDRNAFSTKVLK